MLQNPLMKFLLPSGLLLLLLSVLLLSGACKKTSRDGELYGNWKLTYYSAGGFSGIVISPGPDSVCILSLQGDHGYKRKVNGIVYEYGTYSVSDVTIGGEKSPAVTFKGQTGSDGTTCCVDIAISVMVNNTQMFQVNNDTLMMGMGVVDGPEYQYVRVK
jgi:hypothetical protein